MTRGVVLVTGASGFIGRWSVPPLLAAGYHVHAVTSREAAIMPPPTLRGATLHRADLLDPEASAALLRAVRPSHLLHFAWIAAPRVYWTSPDNERWLAASQRLLEEFHALGGARAVVAGTCAEYDWSGAGVCDEMTSPLADASNSEVTPYADCKIRLQRWLQGFAREHALSAAWGRIFFQFGPDEHPDRLVASVILNLLSGREAWCTPGLQIRSFLHVADVGAAFAALLDSRLEGPVNVGSGERVAIAELVGRIGTRIGRAELVRLGARPSVPRDPPLLVPVLERLHGELGWRPRFALDAALDDTIAWWRAAPKAG